MPDGGAAHFAACVREIKRLNPATAVEALTPDFQGVLADVETVVDSGLDVFAQNVETVRAPDASGARSARGLRADAAVLAHAKRHRPDVLTKTSLMLGLGETDDGNRSNDGRPARGRRRPADAGAVPAADAESPGGRAFRDARGVRRATASAALAKGFLECVSGPLVRSSYRAERALERNNAGLGSGGVAG